MSAKGADTTSFGAASGSHKERQSDYAMTLRRRPAATSAAIVDLRMAHDDADLVPPAPASLASIQALGAKLPVDMTRMERAIDLRRLRYFVHIVAEGSFSTAAQRVCVAQPALSHHVRELEAVLGVPLLTRSPHGVVPTDAGRCLYEHGLTILGRVRAAALEISAFNRDAPPQVAIGLQSSAASVLTAPLFEAIRMMAPDLRLSIEEGSNAAILSSLEGKRVDIALLYDAPNSKAITQQGLLTEALCLISPPDTHDGEICLDEAVRLPLILPPRGNRLRERMESTAQACKSTLNVVIEMESAASIKKLVRAGLGHSVLSSADVLDEHRMGLLQRRPIIDPQLQQTLSLCMQQGKVSRGAGLARRLISDVVEELIVRAEWPGLMEIGTTDARPRAYA